MQNKTGNYSAFYVGEPFNPSGLGAHATPDFVTYSMLRAWKGKDSAFPFNDSHNKNYNVRDGSDWLLTLRPRLRQRLNLSKNIILVLSSITTSSRALREEIDYGINNCELPVIVIYPDFSEKSDIIDCDKGIIKQKVKNLWAKLPVFRDNMHKVPTIHIPNKKVQIQAALSDPDFKYNTKTKAGTYFYKC